MYHTFFIHSYASGHLACLHGLATVNTAVMDIEVRVSFSVMVSSRHMLIHEIFGSSGSFIPSFLRNLHIVLYSGCNSLHYLFSKPSSAFIICGFFDDGHSDQCGVWYLIVLLIYISPIISNVEYLFMCLLMICTSSLRKCLFRSSAHFLIGVFCFCFFLVLSYICCLHILEINPLSVVSFAIIFSHSEGCLFTPFIICFNCAKAVKFN